MANKVIIAGNLGQDPEIRHLQNGKKIAQLSIATSDRWKDKETGERREKTEWHRVVIFPEGLANVAEKYLKKGSKVYIEGALRTRKWEDTDGNDRWTTEIVLNAFGGVLELLDRAEGSGQQEALDKAHEKDLDDDIPY